MRATLSLALQDVILYSGFGPSALFASGAQGAWYDPSDFSTLFQNSTGTTPVTAVEQPVRLMLDRSRGLVLGGELVTNGTFDANVTGWAEALGSGAALTWSSGQALLSSGFNGARAYQVITTVVGRLYVLKIQRTGGTATSSGYRVTTDATGGPTGQITAETAISGNWSRTVMFVATATATTIAFLSTSGGAVDNTFDNVSVRELPGNHAVAPNDASRPVLRARYNLLTFSEQFDNAAWANTFQGTGLAPTVTANAGTDPLGGSTADRLQFSLDGGTTTSDITRRRQSLTTPATSHTFSVYLRSTDGVSSYNMHIVGPSGSTTNIVVTGAWQRFTVTEIGSGGATTYSVGLRGGQSPANANTADVLAWGASLLTAADQTATGGAYQRIAAATDYDTSNPVWRPYLAFDGSDDSFSTSAIDFSGTDEMTVFAGLSKLSDVTSGFVAELTTSSSSINGSFHLAAPDSSLPARFQFASRGTVRVEANETGIAFISPTTRVLTGIGDISGDVATLRIDGTQAATNTNDQGTGNYANAPLFIGRRNNGSLPFNGRLYSLAVLGRTATAAELSAMETWINGKTGAY